MKRVAYNNCYGGFALNEDVIRWIRENRDRLEEEYGEETVEVLASATISGEMYDDGSGPKGEYMGVYQHQIKRESELLADIIVGETDYDGAVNIRTSELRVAEVPDGVAWTVDEYDGQETVREKSQRFS